VGLSLKDVEVVSVEPPEMMAALFRNDIAGFFVWEPWITKTKFAGGDKVNLLKGVEFYLVHNHLVMDKEWVLKNPDVALRVTKAIQEAGEFVHKNPAEASKMIAKYLKLDEPLVAALLPKTNFMMVLDDNAMAFLKTDVDALIANGKIKAPFDYQGYVYPDVIRKIDPKLVVGRGKLSDVVTRAIGLDAMTLRIMRWAMRDWANAKRLKVGRRTTSTGHGSPPMTRVSRQSGIWSGSRSCKRAGGRSRWVTCVSSWELLRVLQSRPTSYVGGSVLRSQETVSRSNSSCAMPMRCKRICGTAVITTRL